MIEVNTVFKYQNTSNTTVELRGFLIPNYALSYFDEIDLAVVMRLASQASWPTDRSALCLYKNTSKYMIQGWPGNQANNLNFCNANGTQFYLSDRFLQTGVAQPTKRDLTVKFRCVATNNWFGHVDVSWQMYLGNELKSLLETIYNDTGREYRLRVTGHWSQYDGSMVSASGDKACYYTKDNGNNWETLTKRSSVSGSNTARAFWTGSQAIERKINNTWTSLTPITITGADVSAGTIGPFSNGATTYYGNNSTFGGSGGGTTHLCVYSAS